MPTSSCKNLGLRVYKPNVFLGSVKETSRVDEKWVGDLEYRVLSVMVEVAHAVYLREIAKRLGVNSRRVYDALKRLMARGFVRKVARGLYELCVSVRDVACLRVRNLGGRVTAVKENSRKVNDTRVSLGCGFGFVSGPFFDNVRGYCGLGYVGGDRGGVVEARELVRFNSISYAEVLYRVRGLKGVGCLVVYSNEKQDGGAVRVEWRPPKGYVKCNGVASAVRMYWEQVLNGFKALFTLIFSRESPLSVKLRALRFINGSSVAPLIAL